MKKAQKFFIGLLVISALMFLTAKSWAEESQESKDTTLTEPEKTAVEKLNPQKEKAPEEKAPTKEADPVEKQKEAAELKTEPAAEKKLVGCVAPIKDLVKTYQKELASLQKLIEKWNTRLESAMQRESLLSKEINSLEKEYDKKKDSEDKREKKEADRLKGQLKRMAKEQKILKKEMLRQCKELSAELGEFGKGSSVAIAEQIRQILQEIAKSEEE